MNIDAELLEFNYNWLPIAEELEIPELLPPLEEEEEEKTEEEEEE